MGRSEGLTWPIPKLACRLDIKRIIRLIARVKEQRELPVGMPASQ